MEERLQLLVRIEKTCNSHGVNKEFAIFAK